MAKSWFRRLLGLADRQSSSLPLTGAADAVVGEALAQEQRKRDREAHVSPLHRAAFEGDEPTVRSLLEAGAEPNPRMTRRCAGVTLLHDTPQRVLYQFGGLGATPLHLATDRGHEGIARMLVEAGADVTAVAELAPATARKPPLQETPLHGAARSCGAELAQRMLDRGAQLEIGSQSTPLCSAATAGNTPVVELLIARGANLEAIAHFGGGSLELAARGGHVDAVRVLLEAGARVDAGGREGLALRAAGRGGSVAIVELLLARGARLVSDRYGSALHMAAEAGRVEVIGPLVAAGADVDARSEEGETALAVAVAWHYEAVVRALLEHGADPDAADAQGSTPLHDLASFSEGGELAPIAAVLLDAGAAVDARDAEGRTPLHRAIGVRPDREDDVHELPEEERHRLLADDAVAALLLDRGADVDARDGEGRTPLGRVTRGAGWERIEALLRERGGSL